MNTLLLLIVALFQTGPVDLYRGGFQVREQPAADYRGDDFQLGLRYGARKDNLGGRFESYTAFQMIGMRHHLFWDYDFEGQHNFGYVTSIGSEYLALGGGVLYDRDQARYPVSLLLNTPYGYLGGTYRFNDDRYTRFDLGIRPFQQLGFTGGIFYRGATGWSFASGITLYSLFGADIGYQFSGEIDLESHTHMITLFWDSGYISTGGGWSSRDHHWYLESTIYNKKSVRRSRDLDQLYLHIKLDRPLPQGGDGGVLRGDRYTFLNLLTVIREGVKDTRIKGYLFELQGTPLNIAQVEELSKLLEKRHNQKVLLHLTDPNLSNYLLGGIADEIILHPAGFFQIQGVTFSTLYLKQFLNLLGIQPHFSRRSEYKTAPENMIRNRPSKYALDSLKSIGKSIRSWSKQQILKRRKIVGVHSMIDQAPYTPKNGVKLGLVDRTGYVDDLIDQLRNQRIGVVKPSTYLKLYRRELYGIRHQLPIAVLNIEGVIGAGGETIWGRQGVTRRETLSAIKAIRQGGYAGVIVRIDSPGGSGLVSDEIYHALMKLRKEMPVYISMGSIAASGGYYIAAAGEKIYATGMSLTGSIGVYMGHFVVKQLLKKFLVSIFSISLWRNGHFMSLLNEPDDHLKHKQEELVEDFYQLFKQRVADGRRMTLKQVEDAAKGRVFFAPEGKKLGLVDQIGGFYDAVGGIQQRLNSDLPVSLTVYPRRYSLLKQIFAPERRLLSGIKETLTLLKESTLLILPFFIHE